MTTNQNRIWILSNKDPEMEEIENLLHSVNEYFLIAVGRMAQVRSDNTQAPFQVIVPENSVVYLVENYSTLSLLPSSCQVVIIDHHRLGDPGYGKGPSDFLPASSLGQVIVELAKLGKLPPEWFRVDSSERENGIWLLKGYRGVWTINENHKSVFVPQNLLVTAACDHCLRAAYNGECNGVCPLSVLDYRLKVRAAARKCSENDVDKDIKETSQKLLEAKTIEIGGRKIKDMRETVYPELPDAGAITGLAYVASFRYPHGTHKIVCSGDVDDVSAFLEWLKDRAVTDIYGDPLRGFAGAISKN